jgi:hypothetical protein
MRDAIIIKWYRKNQWGQVREFIHPDCQSDAKIIGQLTGQKTITGPIRELVRDLSRGYVTWQEVIAP